LELVAALPQLPTAYLLISHGSRDPRPQAAMDRLAEMVRDRLVCAEAIAQPAQQSPRTGTTGGTKASQGGGTSLLVRAPQPATEVIVRTACLELAAQPLSQRIYELGVELIDKGIQELKLLPVFLMSGVHVMEDIPEEIEQARALLGDALTLTVCPHLGSHPDISDVLANRLASVSGEGSLLVAHGSRRPKGNRIIQSLAKQLDTAVAYWATPPDIEAQVIELMQQGYQKLTILPYFLFAGGITDAITHRTEELAERFPRVQFRLLPTLGATHEVANLAIDLMQ